MKKFHKAEDLKIMKIAEKISDNLYSEIKNWDQFNKKTIGVQLVRAADSIGANIAEGHGRFHIKDSVNFTYYSRGSLEETKFWLKRAFNRALINKEIFDYNENLLSNLAPQLNAFINAKKRRLNLTSDL